MAEYKLTNKAVKDLANIWEYTFEIWSERQADNYYQALISACKDITENPDLGKSYEGITTGLLGMRANRHIIFYRLVNKNYIEITRILHEKMDLKKRVTE